MRTEAARKLNRADLQMQKRQRVQAQIADLMSLLAREEDSQ
jgi:hypothetical protein